MIIKKVLTAGGVGVIGTCIVYWFTKKRKRYRILNRINLFVLNTAIG